MHLHKKKILIFKSSTWFVGDTMFYIARIPRVDILHIQQTYPFNQHAKRVLISEFIMAHHTNELRQKAAYFVFGILDWVDNICIRSAIELDLLTNYPEDSIPRIVNGEVWTDTDWEIEGRVGNPATYDRAFSQYPELPYGVVALPPYAPFEDSPITRLEPGIPSDSTSFTRLVEQLAR